MPGGAIQLHLYRARKEYKQQIWRIFENYHYLSKNMNLASELYYIEYNNIIIGVISILPFPTGNTKYIFRIHRLVILPDYQNLCIGSKLLDLIGEYYINQGKKLFITTIHERIHNHCKKLKLYRETNSNKHTRHTVSSLPQFKNAFLNRKTYSYEYVGSDYYNKLHKIIIADKDEILDEKELIELKKTVLSSSLYW